MIGSDQALLVTGGTGLLGAHVLRALDAHDMWERVFVGSRREPSATSMAFRKGRHWHLDLGDEIALPIGLDTVMHIAGEKLDVDRMWEINHAGTRRLIDAAAKAGVQRFVYVSSVGVYGAPKHAGLVDESSPRTPGDIYEKSKDAGETAVREMCPRLGMNFVVVQPTNVISHASGHSYPLLGLISAIKTDRFAFFGAREAWVNYVHVESAAAAIVFAARSARDSGTYIANTPARLVDLVGWVADELGVAAPRRRIPAWLGASAGVAGSALRRVAGRGMPFDSQRYLELTNTTRYCGDGLARELGFKYPVGIETGVRRLVNAYREERRL